MRTSPTGKKRSKKQQMSCPVIGAPGLGPQTAAEHDRFFKAGFTFIELIVVVGIFTFMLLFAIPMFRQINLTANASDQVSSLIVFLEDLKLKAMVQQKDFTLYMDPGSGKIYVTDNTMDEDARQQALNNGISLEGDLQLLNLEFADDDTRDPDDDGICFFAKGYSDRVLIHLKDDDRKITLQVCMFRKKVHLIDKYVSYDDCI